MASKLVAQGRQRLAKAPEGDPAAPAASTTPAPADVVSQRVPAVVSKPAVSEQPVPAVAVVPEPQPPIGDGPLSPAEESVRAACEAAIDNLRLAFTAAGKALQVIRDGRLYRDTHPTFEAYGLDRWNMSRPQLYRLIEEWSLGERLSPINAKVNERQVRELLPVKARHGEDAAVAVYKAVIEVDDVPVSAAVLKDVVGLVPADNFDQADAASQIQAYLTGKRGLGHDPRADPSLAFTTESGKLVKSLRRLALAADPAAVRQAVAGIRSALDEIESDLP